MKIAKKAPKKVAKKSAKKATKSRSRREPVTRDFQTYTVDQCGDLYVRAAQKRGPDAPKPFPIPLPWSKVPLRFLRLIAECMTQEAKGQPHGTIRATDDGFIYDLPANLRLQMLDKDAATFDDDLDTIKPEGVRVRMIAGERYLLANKAMSHNGVFARMVTSSNRFDKPYFLLFDAADRTGATLLQPRLYGLDEVPIDVDVSFNEASGEWEVYCYVAE